MKFLDFMARIVVDGRELPEYRFQCNEQTKTASCWVPSQAGKPFLITGMPVRQSDVDIAVRVFADGSYIDGCVFRKGMKWGLMTWSGPRISAMSTRSLMFASIEFTDDDSFLNSVNTKYLGDITLQIAQVEIVTKLDEYRKLETEPSFTNKVHERTKKAVSHKVNLGREINNPVSNFFQVRCIFPMCQLTFKYRPIDVLKADGIIPPAPAAPLTEVKRKALCDSSGDSDNEEEEKRVAKDKSKKVKIEHHPCDSDVIDLT